MMKRKKIKKPANKPAKTPKKSVHIKASYPHFRYYRKSKHPALVVGEHSLDEYRYRKVTHEAKDGRHLNEKIFPNPNKKDPKPMYIGKRVRHDKMSNFENTPLSWKYPKK